MNNIAIDKYELSKATIGKADLTVPCDMLDKKHNKQAGFKKYDKAQMPGVYAFYDPDTFEVAYVGKALQVKKRVVDHWYENERLFDWMLEGHMPSVAVWYCDPTDRATIERSLILALDPVLNVQDGN